jgi:hypothetical protein
MSKKEPAFSLDNLGNRGFGDVLGFLTPPPDQGGGRVGVVLAAVNTSTKGASEKFLRHDDDVLTDQTTPS